MSERPPESQRRLTLVPRQNPLQPTEGAEQTPTNLPVFPSNVLGRESSDHFTSWGARLVLELPNGVLRHPTLSDRIEEVVGFLTPVDVACAGIRVAYPVEANTHDDALHKSSAVAWRIMDLLSLDERAICEHLVMPLVDEPLLEGDRLRPVR